MTRRGRIAIALLAVAAFPCAIAITAARREILADFHPVRGPVPPPSASELRTVRSVSFDSAHARLRGWYLPPPNGTTIILVHGTAADRRALVPEARILARGGYGILLFDLPGHGESTGQVTWDASERDALRAAIDFIGDQSDAGAHRIGVFGFSMGSMIAVQVAATERRIGALAVAGAFADPDSPLRHQFRRWGLLSEWPAVWAAHYAGMHPSGVRPGDLVASLAPRPVLIIAGSEDDVVPLENAQDLFRDARDPKLLFVAEGAHHGDYAAVAPSAYAEKLVGFFDRAFSGGAADD